MNLKSKIQNLKSRRRGVILLLVVSLLALFVLMGVSFSLVAMNSLHASKLDIKRDQVGDGTDTEMDLVLGQILYDTQSRTVLQYHSLLRDLYGYDANQVIGGVGPQLRESFQGMVINAAQQPNGVNFGTTGPSAGNQFYTFNFALGPFPVTSANPQTFPSQGSPVDGGGALLNSLTALSQLSNYYAGRVITFTSGVAANHSARIVVYNPVAGYTQHQLNASARFVDGSTSAFYPAYGQITIEAIESKLAGSIAPSPGDSFVVNGAPFNGAGAGYDTITANIDAMVVSQQAYLAAKNSSPPQALSTVLPKLGEYSALLPNYASYDDNNSCVVFNALDPTPGNMGLKQAVANNIALGAYAGFGGFDESWDAPDFQNMFLAMVPPKAAINQYSGSALPIIPSFHRPELINYWVNFIQTNILAPIGIPSNPSSPTAAESQMMLALIAYPFGPDGQPDSGDELLPPSQSLALRRIHAIMHGCILRPMPWDHPNFTGSNPYLAAPSGQTDTFGINNALKSIINSPVLNNPLIAGFTYPNPNQPIWDVDNDSDGIPDSVWIDPGLPIITTPEGRRYKRLAAILVKDLDGSINVNAHGNLQQVYAFGGTYPYLANTAITTGMMASGYTSPPLPSGYGYTYGVGMANTTQLFPRGLGFGPAEVQFSNLLGNDAAAYSNILFSRYVSQRQTFPFVFPNGSKYTASPVPDTLLIDNTSTGIAKTGLPFARPGLPYYRDTMSVIKHNGVPNDYQNNAGLLYPALQPSWYASPPDVWGRGAVLLDVGGQPLMTFMGQANEMFDSPYEMCLSGEENGADSPYTVAELEVLYRYHDADASQLARRLLNAGYSSTSNTNYLVATNGQNTIDFSHARRNSLTTLSSHIPAPTMRAPQEVRVNSNLNTYLPMMGSTSILDLYRAKIAAGGAANVAVSMQQVVPWEFWKGQKFDLNRWLGDGIDNDADGYRDDISEASATTSNPYGSPSRTRERAFQGDDYDLDGAPDVDSNGNVAVPNMSLPGTFKNIAQAYTNGLPLYYAKVTDAMGNVTYPPVVVANGYAARQLYARHLFCLAMLMLPDDTSGASKFQPAFAYDSNNSTTNGRALMVRRIAQWAINCVDSRDPDSAMTPFEFDFSPFTDDDGNPNNGTWDVDGFIGMNPGPDGILGTGDDVSSPDESAANNYRGLVWGMEAPDLLITETLAFHDRGLKDTNQDTGVRKYTNTALAPSQASPPDPDLDQFRMPKGSLFVELYSPRSKAWAGEPTNYKTPSGALPLGYVAPVTGGRPLWRLAFAALTTNANPTVGDTANPNSLVANSSSPKFLAESLSPEIVYWNGTKGTVFMDPFSTSNTQTNLVIDRFAYFTDVSTLLTSNELNASYYNVYSAPSLSPGQYAVVGPRPLTYLGSQDPGGASPPIWGGNSNQYIQLVPGAGATTNSVVVYDSSGNLTSRSNSPAASADMQQPVAIICDAPAPTGSTITWRVGMNVSEPLPNSTSYSYYPAPTSPAGMNQAGIPTGSGFVNLASNPTATPSSRASYPDFYDDPDAPNYGFKDQPIEESSSPYYSSNWPIAKNGMQATGTYQNSSAVLLQRLADATSPYNPLPYDPNGNSDPNYNPALPVNPYITVDWSSLDVTVFNGEESAVNSAYSSQPFYYQGSSGPAPLYFRSRQRGFLANSSTQLTSNPWPPVTRNGLSTAWHTPLSVSTTYFNCPLSNNSKTVNPAVAGTAAAAFSTYSTGNTYSYQNDIHTLGSLNSTIDYPIVNGQINGAQTPYYGEPFVPFPWLTWNNRPFSNAMELLNVPASSPGRLALEMTPDYPIMPDNTNAFPLTGNSANPYSELPTPTPANIPYRLHWPFAHMLNMFQTSQINTLPSYGAGSPTFPNAQTSAVQAPHLYRIFDYVEVPSPFAGSERWYNPNYFTSTVGYEAPFNKHSRFRDPGRINLNTIFDDDIWDAAVSQFPGMRSADGFSTQMALSRQGDGGTVNQMNAAYPTRFANPFRSADSADLMPPVGASSMRTGVPVYATPLRPDPTTLANSNPQPLFQIKSSAAAGNWLPTVNDTTKTYPSRTAVPDPPGYPANAHDIKRNPYFRHQPLQKLGAVATTNSNCFTVWITIGYFEVEENRPVTSGALAGQIIFDAAHPDGYALGQEVGIDTGNVTRHRGFFIIDRSIPVGFIPGSRLNTDDCVLVRRLIE